ncbi:DNA-packaging protein, partial [Enterobacter hormaechei]
MTTAEQKAYARKVECEEDGLYYARYFFKLRTGGKMIVAPHHKVIQQTLDRVIDGEIQRLIINVPPGYTKTELATINMMGRGLALNCRARFMHLSYSHNLALLNSSTARGMIKSQAYQSMWPMALRDDADSKAMWWTEYGGGVYASSAAGQVTGFRAGHMEPGWQGALIIDDPVKPDDAYSEIVRDGVNNRFNETIKSRLAIETTPMIVIMQRIHYHDLSGYLLRGGSGEKWHHLNLPVIIDSSRSYEETYPENTHAIPIDHGLPDGWLWPFKHNESHRVSLFSHRRTAEAQYMQNPKRFNAEGALWNEEMISAAHAMRITQELARTVVAIDPQATNSEESDESGIAVASVYGSGDERQYSLDADYSGKYSPNGWATKAIDAYIQHEADAI